MRRRDEAGLPPGVARCITPFVAEGPLADESDRTYVVVRADGEAPRRVKWTMALRAGDLLPASDPVVARHPESFEQR
jgi:hypothetical protein